MAHDNPLRIPEPLRHDVEEIFKLTDPFCAEHLDAEYGEVKGIEKAIAEAYRGWSDVQRRSIWCETDGGMTDDDDDDSLCDTSFNGIGYALQVEMLDEVTHAAWQEAEELKKAAAKRPRRKQAAT